MYRPNSLHRLPIPCWLAGLCAALLLTTGLSSSAASTRSLHGHIPAALAHLQAVGRLDPNTNLWLAIGLPLRNQAALTNFIRELYEPASPQFRRYLSVQQFSEQFGPRET